MTATSPIAYSYNARLERDAEGNYRMPSYNPFVAPTKRTTAEIRVEFAVPGQYADIIVSDVVGRVTTVPDLSELSFQLKGIDVNPVLKLSQRSCLLNSGHYPLTIYAFVFDKFDNQVLPSECPTSHMRIDITHTREYTPESDVQILPVFNSTKSQTVILPIIIDDPTTSNFQYSADNRVLELSMDEGSYGQFDFVITIHFDRPRIVVKEAIRKTFLFIPKSYDEMYTAKMGEIEERCLVLVEQATRQRRVIERIG
jgi:hypothetical protein